MKAFADGLSMEHERVIIALLKHPIVFKDDRVMIGLLSNYIVFKDDVEMTALLNHPRLELSTLAPAVAKRMLYVGMDAIVESFYGVSENLQKTLVTLSEKAELSPEEIGVYIMKAALSGEIGLAEEFIDVNHGNIPNLDSMLDCAVLGRNMDIAKMLINKGGSDALNGLVNKCIGRNLETFLRDILETTGKELTKEQVKEFTQ